MREIMNDIVISEVSLRGFEAALPLGVVLYFSFPYNTVQFTQATLLGFRTGIYYLPNSNSSHLGTVNSLIEPNRQLTS